MFEGLTTFFKRVLKPGQALDESSKDTAKERLHLVLMQDRANVSADFLELMKQEIIDVIKKYIEVDEGAIDVRLTNKANDDGTTGAPALYANIPIKNIVINGTPTIKETPFSSPLSFKNCHGSIPFVDTLSELVFIISGSKIA